MFDLIVVGLAFVTILLSVKYICLGIESWAKNAQTANSKKASSFVVSVFALATIVSTLTIIIKVMSLFGVPGGHNLSYFRTFAVQLISLLIVLLYRDNIKNISNSEKS